jgi:hypothetical protein
MQRPRRSNEVPGRQPHPSKSRKAGVTDRGEGSNDTPAGMVVAGLAGWAGLALGLLNVYPTLYPWGTVADKVIGIVVCVLITSIAARTAFLAARSELDWVLIGLVVLCIGLLAALFIPLGEALETNGPAARAAAEVVDQS